MPDELSTLLEGVAADGADRSLLSAEAVRARGTGLRRRRRIAAGLGSAALVTGLLGGVAVVAAPGHVPATAAGSSSAGFPKGGLPTAGSTTVATPPQTGPATCRRPAPTGDVDGDCKKDQVSVSGHAIVVQGTRAGRLSVTVNTTGPLRIAAVTDADQDGFADIWVRTGTSNVYLLMRYDGRTLATVSDDQGRPLRLRLDGSPARDLLGCVGHDVNVYTRTLMRVDTIPEVVWLVTRESTHAVC